MKVGWIVVVGLSPPVVAILHTIYSWREQGQSSAQVFARRELALTFVTACGGVAALAVVVAIFYDLKDGLGLIGFVSAELIAFCLYWRQFEDHGFVTQLDKENKERLRPLLLEGFGMDETTVEAVFEAVENTTVEFWRSKLATKAWTDFSDSEIGALMFTSGLETAKVIVEKAGDDVHWVVAAYMKEWVRRVGSVRVPQVAKEELHGRSTEMQKTLICIAIILANETRDVRERRTRCLPRTHLPSFATAAMLARKAATKGLLRWPECLSGSKQIKIQKLLYDTKKLCALTTRKMGPDSDEIPQSVRYTLRQMIKAEYIKMYSNASISVTISFEDSYMIIRKDDWNEKMAISLQPFKYITAIRWMGNDPAFIVEERDGMGGSSGFGGSRSLKGTLRVEAEVEMMECAEWLQTADIRNNESGIWGRVEDFIQPNPVSTFKMSALWILRTAWALPRTILRLYGSLQDRTRGQNTSSV